MTVTNRLNSFCEAYIRAKIRKSYSYTLKVKRGRPRYHYFNILYKHVLGWSPAPPTYTETNLPQLQYNI